MKRNAWEGLKVVNVLGVSLGEVTAVIETRARAGEKEINRIYESKDGVLVQLRDTDPDADRAFDLLISKFGESRVKVIYPEEKMEKAA